MTETTPLKDLVQSVKVPAELIKAAGEPPALELGQGLADIIYLIFSPIKKWRASAEANIEKYKTEIAKELDKIEPEKRTEPKLSVAGPALEASKYYIEEDELRSMFAKLIAASANTDYQDGAIPAFVEIIKQLSAFDAKNLIELKKITYCQKPLVAGKLRLLNPETGMGRTIFEHYIPLADFNNENSNIYAVSIDNLQRLGLIIIHHGSSAKREFHDELLNLDFYKEYKAQLTELQKDVNRVNDYYIDKELVIEDATWNFTDFGELFIKCCLD